MALLSPLPEVRPPTERRLDLVVPPEVEPVTVGDEAPSLRIQVKGDPKDALARIAVARDWLERETGLAFIKQTWDLRLDDAGANYPGFKYRLTVTNVSIGPVIELPKPPLLFVDGIFVTDDSGIETTVDPSIYWVSALAAPATTRSRGRIALRVGNAWPSHRAFEGFRIRFTCGYGEKPSDVPFALRRAIILLAALERYPSKTQGAMPPEVLDLISPYRTDFIAAGGGGGSW